MAKPKKKSASPVTGKSVPSSKDFRSELSNRIVGIDNTSEVSTADLLFSNVKDYLDTGIPELNWAISGSSRKGIPHGRVICIDGLEQTGKTALGFYLLGQAKRQGVEPILVETENALDVDFAAKNSLDLTNTSVIGMRKASLENTFAIITEAITLSHEQGKKSLVVLDSLAACMTDKELEETSEDYPRSAKKIRALLGQMLPKISGCGFMFVIINHLIYKFGGFGGEQYIPRGGTGLSFWTTARLTLSVKQTLKKAGATHPYAVIIQSVTNKTRLTSPKRLAYFQITFEKGIDPAASIFQQLNSMDLIKTHGAWFSIEGIPEKFHREDFYKILEKHPEIGILAYDAYDPDKVGE